MSPGDTNNLKGVPKPKREVAHANLVSNMTDKMQGDLKKKLNVKTLPTEMIDEINDTAKSIAETLTRQDLTKTAMRAGREYFRQGDTKKVIGDRLSSALEGVKLVSQSNELTQLLDENARMLFAKRKALIGAGFTESEAFQLILAEVSAKKANKT